MGVVGLLLGNFGSNFVHVECFDLGDEALECGLGEGAWLGEDLDAIAESHDGRDGLDSEAAGERLLGFGVDLGKNDAFVLFGRCFVHGSECFTWAAPAGPEIDEDNAFGENGIFELVGRYINGAHVATSLSLRGVFR